MVSRADESANDFDVGAEFRSRMVEVSVDGSKEQTENVMERQAENVENPFEIKHVDKVYKACMKWHISNLPEFDIMVNPAGMMLKQYIPTVFTTARRDFPKYLANCEGIARFYHKDRLIADIDGQKTLFVTPKDIFLNHYIFGTSLIGSALRCSHVEKQMIKVIEKHGQLTKQDLQRHLRSYNVNVTIRIIENHLKHLADLGYLNVDKPKRENFYSVSEFYDEFSVDPDFYEIIGYIKEKMRTVEQYQPYAEEYIERFCSEEAMNVVDPITGETINMLTYEFDKPHEVQLQNEETRRSAKTFLR